MTTSTKTRAPSLTAANVQVAFLVGGTTNVKALPEFQAHKDPRPVLKKVLKSLKDYPQVDSAPLAMLLDTLNADKRSNTGGRGIPAPQVGETRAYKVQQNKKTGALYMTVPVVEGSIEVTAGDTVEITFNDGSIVLA